MGLIRVSNQIVVKIKTIKISMNICHFLLRKHFNWLAISSEILKGSSISTYYITGGACVINCFEA